MQNREFTATQSAVKTALAKSQVAVETDMKSLDPTQTLSQYKDAVEALKFAVKSCRAQEEEGEEGLVRTEVTRLTELMQVYERRILVLEGTTPIKISKVQSFFDLFDDHGYDGPGETSVQHTSLNLESLRNEIEAEPELAGLECSPGSREIVSSCWKLRAIHRTISGGFLTAEVFIPPNTYIQPGARIIGLLLKMEVYEALCAKLAFFAGDTKGRPPPSWKSSDNVVVEALENLNALAAEMATLHDRLHRSFPSYVAERVKLVSQGARVEAVVREHSSVQSLKAHRVSEAGNDSAGVPQGPPRSWAVWGAAAGKAAMAVGRTAVALGRSAAEASTEIATAAGKTALSAYERAKNVLPERMTEESAGRFIRAVDGVCVGTQALTLWASSFADEVSKLKAQRGHVATLQAGGAAELGAAFVEIEATFATIGRFLDGVVVELMVRDLEVLLELQSTRVLKEFSEVDWDLGDMATGPSVLVSPVTATLATISLFNVKDMPDEQNSSEDDKG